MQGTLDASSLKQITRALACLSKYSEDLVIYATPETFALSATNQSQSAYARFKFRRQFFSRYSVNQPPGLAEYGLDVNEVAPVTGQLQTKNLLSILKHKTVEKSVDKCELVITDGESQQQNDSEVEEEDSLESRLIVRLHCKHGVIKTHRLLLQSPDSLLAPAVPNAQYHSRLTIGPRAVRDMIEHFPFQKNSKSDPQLIWTFNDYDVQLKSMETALNAKGGPQVNTELTISADEFDKYEVYDTPVTVSFHLKEFNATIALAEAASLPLEISFTDPMSPIFIDLDGDLSETLFVISTSGLGVQVQANSRQRTTSPRVAIPQQIQARGQKRPLEEANGENTARASVTPGPGTGLRDSNCRTTVPERIKPMKVVQTTDRASVARDLDGDIPRPTPLPLRESMPPPSLPIQASMHPPSLPVRGSMPPPSLLPAPSPHPSENRQAAARPSSSSTSQARRREPLFLPSSQPLAETPMDVDVDVGQMYGNSRPPASQPLFLPGTQLSEAAEQAIRESGLGIENMTAQEFAAMLEGEGEEVEFDLDLGDGSAGGRTGAREASLDIYDEMEPTQQQDGGTKAFKPLFED